MLYWLSPEVPGYIDIDALAYLVYQNFYDNAPCKSSNMRDGIQYTIVGNQVYFWNEVIYAHWQDTGCGGNGGAYEGWWSTDLIHTWNYWLEIEKEVSYE